MMHARILLDIEVQRDFFSPGGSCYNRSSTAVAKAIYRLFDWARGNGVPVISTVLRVHPGARGPIAPGPHCVEGADGERKLSRTVLSRRINLGMRNITDLPRHLLRQYRQVIFEKRDTDIFRHPRAERLITEMPPATFVVCGAGIAHGIAQATIGLRTRGFGVIVAADAVLELGDELEAMAYERMETKGVIFTRTSQIVSPRAGRPVRPFRSRIPAKR